MQLPELDLRQSVTERWNATIGAIDIVFGPGARHELPQLTASAGYKRALVVTDPGVRGTGYMDEVGNAMRGAGTEISIFDDVIQNPTTATVARGVDFARDFTPDLIVGFGGGSAMDAAKGVNFVLTNGGAMEDYEGTGKARQPLLPSFGVPTTAGTGSEGQSYALISRDDDHRKMACGDPGARFRVAVLDPELLSTTPRAVRFVTGIDAIAHAVESHVCQRANPVSRLFSGQAWKRLSRSFASSLDADAELAVRGDMLLGAHLAGAAIEASMLGAAHACANPLTARYGTVHGLAVGLLLPHVVRHNWPAAGDAYQELAGADLPQQLNELLAAGGMPMTLREHGIEHSELPTLAAEAATQWTAQFNPGPAQEADLHAIYEAAY
ncbi:MAG: iron-containing alcohol dehydrogenase [Acidobacteria bacterium]|nr:iron-containing alcohol dehydrogenase [Acidobacteriota bacterium]